MTSGPRESLASVGKWIFAAWFMLGGAGHFLATDVDLKIMPRPLP